MEQIATWVSAANPSAGLRPKGGADRDLGERSESERGSATKRWGRFLGPAPLSGRQTWPGLSVAAQNGAGGDAGHPHGRFGATYARVAFARGAPQGASLPGCAPACGHRKGRNGQVDRCRCPGHRAGCRGTPRAAHRGRRPAGHRAALRHRAAAVRGAQGRLGSGRRRGLRARDRPRGSPAGLPRALLRDEARRPGAQAFRRRGFCDDDRSGHA